MRHCAAILALTACSRATPVDTTGVRNDDVGTLNGASVDLRETGGFAGLDTRYVVHHDDGSFVFVRRHLCDPPACGAPLDSATGKLTPTATDSLFTLIWAQAPMSLADDYGNTRNAADMIGFTLRVTFDGRTKASAADAGTMPPPMERIVDAVHGIVGAATR
jgi:hypothetical protein